MPNSEEQYLISPGNRAPRQQGWLLLNPALWHFPGSRPGNILFLKAVFFFLILILCYSEKYLKSSYVWGKGDQTGRFKFQRL